MKKKEEKKILYEQYIQKNGHTESQTKEQVIEIPKTIEKKRKKVNIALFFSQTLGFILRIVLLFLASVGILALWYPYTREYLFHLFI